MIEKDKKSSSRAKIADISKPGNTAPSSSSRPIIVGNKNVVKDPMVSDKGNSQDEDESKGVSRSTPKVIVPLTDTEKSQDANEAKSIGDTMQIDSIDSNTEKEPNESNDQYINNSSDVVEAVVDQAMLDKSKQDKLEKAEAERLQAEAEELINSRKYFVRTSQEIKKSRLALWLVVFFLIVAVVVYLMIDSKVIHNNINLPVRVFPSSSTSAVDHTNSEINSSIGKPSSKTKKDTDDNSNKPVTAKTKARDQERKNELKILRSMLETYYTGNDRYPLAENWSNEINATDDLIKDPNGQKYEYTSEDGSEFSLKTKLENLNDPDAVNGFYIINSAN